MTGPAATGGQAGVVVVTARSFGSGSRDLVAEVEAAGFRVVRGPATHDLDAMAPLLAQAVAWIAGTGPVTAEHLAMARALRILARYGVGVDAVDLAAARTGGIVVTNTPGANSTAVADHAIALLLALLRGIPHGDRSVRTGDWSVRRGRELGTMTVGLVGFGRIGQLVAQRLRGFGSDILVHDPYVAAEALSSAHATVATLAELAARCDALSLHVPGGARLIDRARLASARRTPVLVNTARADLVDEAALADGLRSGLISGYAADMLASEGRDHGSPLLADDLADRVIITPHLGAQTTEAVDRMGVAAVADVLAVLAGRPPAHPVL